MPTPPPDFEEHPRTTEDDYTSSRRSKGRFRFKSSSSRTSDKRSHSRDPEQDEYHDKDASRSKRSSHREHRHRHGQSHRHRRQDGRRRTRTRSPSPLDPRNPSMNAEAAFRESLFDALGDDEGAAYWESVYGQPIHTYNVPEVPKGPDGELERMDEEEYAAYVRAQMWTRTREGMMEEQDRLRAERRQAKMRENAARGREQERDAFERAMEDSLRRGAQRRKFKAWKGIWEEYLKGWENVAVAVKKVSSSTSDEKGGDGKDVAATPLRNLLFWPVESGKRRDVTPEAVQEFLKQAPAGDLLSTLKVERVRWHPDKIQHRYGVLGVDDKVMRSVTEVFQIVDRMWNEERERTDKT